MRGLKKFKDNKRPNRTEDDCPFLTCGVTGQNLNISESNKASGEIKYIYVGSRGGLTYIHRCPNEKKYFKLV